MPKSRSSKLVARMFSSFGSGVTGNTTVSGTVIEGSIPSSRATFFKSKLMVSSDECCE